MRCKTAEILVLCYQVAVGQRRQPRRLKLNWADRALLATLLGLMPKARREYVRNPWAAPKLAFAADAVGTYRPGHGRRRAASASRARTSVMSSL
jgi:hypothetical protein